MRWSVRRRGDLARRVGAVGEVGRDPVTAAGVLDRHQVGDGPGEAAPQGVHAVHRRFARRVRPRALPSPVERSRSTATRAPRLAVRVD